MPTNVTDPTFTSKLVVWGIDGIEPNTIEQAQMTGRMPFVHSHVALMPDAHVGKGSTIGSVIATDRAIMPAAVGVDIGCGMIAAPLGMHAAHLPDDLNVWHAALTEAIPAGKGKGHTRRLTDRRHTPDLDLMHWYQRENQPEMVNASNKLWSKTCDQFGTLGGGNHFVEVCLDENEAVWLVLHSGSRGVGNEIAKRHIDGAKKLMKQYFIELEDPDLAYFAQHTAEFDAYIHDMLWAQDYAMENRRQMMLAALETIAGLAVIPLTVGGDDADWVDGCMDASINCHHNYTTLEHHHGRDLWVTRKGAIRAREGDLGIIPGSMATGTFLVEGFGNPASFCSAAHGAGRRMSRGQANREVTAEDLRAAMKGKAWNEADAGQLRDEAPAAYKPIEDVMAAQADLVSVVHVLTQVLNVKGT